MELAPLFGSCHDVILRICEESNTCDVVFRLRCTCTELRRLVDAHYAQVLSLFEVLRRLVRHYDSRNRLQMERIGLRAHTRQFDGFPARMKARHSWNTLLSRADKQRLNILCSGYTDVHGKHLTLSVASILEMLFTEP